MINVMEIGPYKEAQYVKTGNAAIENFSTPMLPLLNIKTEDIDKSD